MESVTGVITTIPAGTADLAVGVGCDLSFEGVGKRRGDFALEDVSFGVPSGSVVGLVGSNGAGKTTLMKAALGAVVLDAGRVELFGEDLAALRDDAFSELRRRIAFVGAVLSLPAAMRVTEVVRLYELAYPRFDRPAFKALCSRMGLDAQTAKVGDLSRGMGMKLQLACALSSGADLLLLDEPTAGLDPIVRDEALDALRAWMETEGRSVLMSSHITSDLEHLADYLVMLERGRIVFSCESDVIREVMGVAQLREDELDRVLACWPFAQARPQTLRRTLHTSLLVPDRRAFREAFPDLVCDRATIDDVMAFVAKGEVR